MLVKDIMDRDLTAVLEECPLSEVIEILARHRLSGLPVVDDEGNLVGYISEIDIVKAALPGYFDYLKSVAFIPDFGQFYSRLKKLAHEPVCKYMVKDVICFNEDDTDFHVALEMIKHKIKRAPVVKDGKLVGVISRTDILEKVMLEYEETDPTL